MSSDIASYFAEAAPADDVFSQIAEKQKAVDDVLAMINKPRPDYETLWIPSTETAALLAKILAEPSFQQSPEISKVRTMPVLYAEKQSDPVQEALIQRGRAAENRNLIDVASVSKDLSGLQQLLGAKCFRPALNLTSDILSASLAELSMPGFRFTDIDHMVWCCRFSLLVKLGMAAVADYEMQAFGGFENPDLYYECYPNTSGQKKGSMVPFMSRVLYAQVPHLLGKSGESLERLHSLVGKIDLVLSKCAALPDNNQALTFWNDHRDDTLLAIANILSTTKDFRAAAEVYDTILKKSKNVSQKCRVACLAGRVFLQVGCLPIAQSYFAQAEEICTSPTLKAFLVSLQKGYLDIASGNYEEAVKAFDNAVTNAEEISIRVEAVVCSAVAIMYAGRLEGAIARLEQSLFADPSNFATEPLLLNLATMYELERSSTAESKKLALLDLVAKNCGDAFDIACLKLTPLATSPKSAPPVSADQPDRTMPAVPVI